MDLSLTFNREEKHTKESLDKYAKLISLCLKESMKGNKVSFLYEDTNGHNFSYNKDICFYAASSIKVLVCLQILKMAENNLIDLNKEILVKMEDLKQDTGIIKNQKEDTYYKIIDLIKLCITESDNTAYLKLVDIVGFDNLKQYGLSMGAKHTMEGKDSFGIINATDMLIYWKNIREYLLGNYKYNKLFKEYLTHPSVNYVDDLNVDGTYVRKYGSWDIAYHEAGYVESDSSYYLIILTQLNKKEYKNEFVNEVAKDILELHKTLKIKELI